MSIKTPATTVSTLDIAQELLLGACYIEVFECRGLTVEQKRELRAALEAEGYYDSED